MPGKAKVRDNDRQKGKRAASSTPYVQLVIISMFVVAIVSFLSCWSVVFETDLLCRIVIVCVCLIVPRFRATHGVD